MEASAVLRILVYVRNPPFEGAREAGMCLIHELLAQAKKNPGPFATASE